MGLYTEGLISERAYTRRGLYPRGLIHGGAYIREGLYTEGLISERAYNRNENTVSKRAIAVLIEIRNVDFC